MVTQKETQCKKILRYIEENGSATVRELFIYLNINSPSKRLSELREQGLIDTERCAKENANGEIKRFCRYYLRKQSC